MNRIFISSCLFVFISFVGCEKADQALEAVEKAKNLKNDIEKQYNDTKKDLTGKVDEIKQRVSKEGAVLMDKKESSGQKGNKEGTNSDKKNKEKDD